MPLTPTEQQALIATQLNKAGDAAFASVVATLWMQYDDQVSIDPRLQFLFAKREAIKYLMGLKVEDVDVTEGVASLKRGQRFEHLKDLLDDLNTQIGTIQAAGAPRIAQIKRQVPISAADPPPPYPTEPGARQYVGDPLRRST